MAQVNVQVSGMGFGCLPTLPRRTGGYRQRSVIANETGWGTLAFFLPTLGKAIDRPKLQRRLCLRKH